MIPAFKNPMIDPRGWASAGTWTTEIPSEALARTAPLGRSLFERLFATHPELERDVVFVRWSVQSEDVYAVFDRTDGAFGVQFDPLLGYIIVFGPESTNEIGDWFDDPVAEALRDIETTYLKKQSN
jgi:hypothetical protein